MTTTHTNPFTRLRAGTSKHLDGDLDRFDEADHLWSQPEIDALTVALAARRPLLVRGEAGCGKSQLARAAAAVLGGLLEVEVIHPRYEALDLLWRFDAIARLADAQVRDDKGQSLLDSTNKRYVQYGALGRAFLAAGDSANSPSSPRAVVLIDEIDKADADLPNALLEVMGNRSFKVDALRSVHKVPADHAPLIVVTTNEERELPAAFVRRCVVLNLNPPVEDAGLLKWLLDRAGAHKRFEGIDKDLRRLAARQVMADRVVAAKAGYPKVGLAEFIDLLTALHDLTRDVADPVKRAARQLTWMRQLNAYVLVKNAGQDQARLPVGDEAPAAGAGQASA
jgi:MoxR-like ATPase